MPYVLPGDEGPMENPSSWPLTSRGAENAGDVTAVATGLAHPVIWAVFFPPMCTHLGWHSQLAQLACWRVLFPSWLTL